MWVIERENGVNEISWAIERVGEERAAVYGSSTENVAHFCDPVTFPHYWGWIGVTVAAFGQKEPKVSAKAGKNLQWSPKTGGTIILAPKSALHHPTLIPSHTIPLIAPRCYMKWTVNLFAKFLKSWKARHRFWAKYWTFNNKNWKFDPKIMVFWNKITSL